MNSKWIAMERFVKLDTQVMETGRACIRSMGDDEAHARCDLPILEVISTAKNAESRTYSLMSCIRPARPRPLPNWRKSHALDASFGVQKYSETEREING